MLRRILQFLLTPLPSFLKLPVYRLLGARIHPTARIAPFAVVVADVIRMGPEASINALSIVFGPSSLELGAYAVIRNLCVVNGPSSFSLGPRSSIGVGCMVDLHASIKIGEFSAVGPASVLVTHGILWPSSWGCARKLSPIVIGNLVWAGYGCRIGPGVSVSDETLVLPSSTLSKSVERSAVVHDSGIRRESFSFAFVRRSTTTSWLEAHIRELVMAYHQDELRHDGFELKQEEGIVRLVQGRREVVIHLFHLPAETQGKARHWCFGYDLPQDLMLGQRGIEALDFRQLLHTPRPSRAFANSVRYFNYTYGLSLADARYRGEFTLTPPPLNHRA